VRISATAVLAITLATTSAVASSRHAKAQDNDAADKAPKPAKFDPEWIEPFFKSGPAKKAVERYRAEDWSEAETGFAKAVRALPKSSPERRAARYLLALAEENQSKWTEAGALFEELYTSYPKLAPYHAYNAARCRLRRGDAAGALEWSSRVSKGSIPEAETILVSIDALRALSRWGEALETLRLYLDRFPSGPRRAEAQFKKGEALEKLASGAPPAPPIATASPVPTEGPEAPAPAPAAAVAVDAGTPSEALSEAIASYRRVWAEAPLEAWSERAADRIKALTNGQPAPSARTHTAAEWVTRGMALFEELYTSSPQLAPYHA